MPFLDVKDVVPKEPVPGFRGRFVHSDGMTVAHWEADAGAVLPMHTHVHEMIVNVLEGELELTVGEETRVLRAGGIAIIPSDVPHGGKALTDCRVLDAFHPVREDYR